MNLERIIQRENESVEDFIKRAIEEVKNTDKQYELIFLDGKILNTENYDLKNEDFDINLIIEDYKKESTEQIPDNKEELNTETIQYIDFLETTLNNIKTQKIESLEEELELRTKMLETEKIRLQKLNEKLVKDSVIQTKMIKELEVKKLANLDTKIAALDEEIKKSEAQIEEKETILEKEKEKLEDYRVQVQQLNNAENPDKALMEELEDKIFYQIMLVENYKDDLDYFKEEHEKLKYQKIENIENKKKVQEEVHSKLKSLKEKIVNKIGPISSDGKVNLDNAPTIREIRSKSAETKIKIGK